MKRVAIAVALIAACRPQKPSPQYPADMPVLPFPEVTLQPYQPDTGRCPKDKPPTEICGSKTAKAINMIHFRIETARSAQKANDLKACVKASHSAMAIAGGLKWFRKYQQQRGWWTANLTYQTRWDGDLSEKAVFAKAREYVKEAKDLFTACGGSQIDIQLADLAANEEYLGLLQDEMRPFFGDPYKDPTTTPHSLEEARADALKTYKRGQRHRRGESTSGPDPDSLPPGCEVTHPTPTKTEVKCDNGDDSDGGGGGDTAGAAPAGGGDASSDKKGPSVDKANACCQACLDKVGTSNTGNCSSSTMCSQANGPKLEACRDRCQKQVMSCTNSCLTKSKLQLNDANVCYNAQS
jgi:hypothetical protein